MSNAIAFAGGLQPDAGGDLRLVATILAEIGDSELLERLRDHRWTGRKGYDPEAMWRAALVRHLLNLRYVRDLLGQLAASRDLRDLCGFEDEVPDECTFSRFYKRLTQYQDLVDQAVASVVDRVGDVLEEFKQAGALSAKCLS